MVVLMLLSAWETALPIYRTGMAISVITGIVFKGTVSRGFRPSVFS
jgi:hypothetical protein